jgi:hypothetical protein
VEARSFELVADRLGSLRASRGVTLDLFAQRRIRAVSIQHARDVIRITARALLMDEPEKVMQLLPMVRRTGIIARRYGQEVLVSPSTPAPSPGF